MCCYYSKGENTLFSFALLPYFSSLAAAFIVFLQLVPFLSDYSLINSSSWTFFADPSGISAESPYSWEDGWLQIKGLDTGSSDPTTRIGAITSAAPIGSRKLTISSLYGVKVGQWVRVIMSDVNGELVKTLYGDIVSRGCGDRFAKENCVADIIGEADLVRWMVRVTAIDGNTITLQRPLPVPVDPSWKAQLHKVPDSMVKEAGIRDITIEFPWTPAADHLREAGYNAVFVSGAVNAFVTNVAVINVDTGFMVSQSTHVSVDGVSVSTSKPRGQSLPFDGHIGIGAYDSTDIEFGNFDIRGEWTHDVTVRGTLMVVAHNGRGDNLNLDSHRSAPYATLYSNLYLGDGTRPYGTGGALSRGYPTARFTTYYNIRNGKWRAIDVPAATMSGACTWGSGVTAVGYWTGDINCPGYHVESYQYGSLEPVDLYGSMIDRKYSTRATTELLPEPPAPVAAPTTANKPPAPPTPASPPTEAVPDPAPVPEEAPMPSKVSLLPPTLSPTSAPTPAAEGPAPAAVSVHAVQKVQTFEVPSAQDSVPEPAGDGTYPVISAPETY